MSKSESDYHFVTQSAVEGSPAPFVGDVSTPLCSVFYHSPLKKICQHVLASHPRVRETSQHVLAAFPEARETSQHVLAALSEARETSQHVLATLPEAREAGNTCWQLNRRFFDRIRNGEMTSLNAILTHPPFFQHLSVIFSIRIKRFVWIRILG